MADGVSMKNQNQVQNSDPVHNTENTDLKKDHDEDKKKSGAPGEYGHLDKYRQKHLFWCVFWFLIILTDVVFSLLVFQTRKTLFTIIGCVMAIPFAQNVVALWLSAGLKPLSRNDYEEVEKAAADNGIRVLYDVTITDEVGTAFYPAMTLENDRIVALSLRKKNPEEKKMAERIRTEFGEDMRYLQKNKLSDFLKELKKMPAAKDKQQRKDKKSRDKLLHLGF